jgi:hypothetical protein
MRAVPYFVTYMNICKGIFRDTIHGGLNGHSHRAECRNGKPSAQHPRF